MQTESYKHRKKTDSMVINLDLKELAVRMSGQYQNDVRVGRWSAFDYEGELIQVYDFNRSSLLYDQSVNDSVYNSGTRQALFLGGEHELRQFILESFNPVTTQYISRDSTRIVGEFIIKSNGTIDQLEVLKGKASRELHHEIGQILSETSGHWLPALEKDKPADSKKVLTIDVFILERKWNSVRYTVNVSSL
jgi:hypothetical protein